MDRAEFEEIAQEAFESLPRRLQEKVENVHIVIDDEPTEETLRKSGIRPGSLLLGLYQGVPLNRRGEDYGRYPVIPDTITLYRNAILSVARSESAVREKIREVLIHEIAHYFGMTERQVREAGY
jgi:predicted Zn-dependent protease with MMP-like domain